MIPKLLHRIWVGPSIPAVYERYWAGWVEMHPGWEAMTWDDRSLAWLRHRDLFDLTTEPQAKADIARYEVLQVLGGVYVDCDVEPLRAIDDLREHPCFAALEDAEVLCNAVMGAEPDHPAMSALVDALRDQVAAHELDPPQLRTGPRFLTDTWASRPDVVRLGPETFYPYGWNEPDPGPPYPGYGVHRWGSA